MGFITQLLVVTAGVFLLTDLNVICLSTSELMLNQGLTMDKPLPSCPRPSLSLRLPLLDSNIHDSDHNFHTDEFLHRQDEEVTCYEECVDNGGGENDCCHCGKAISWYCEYLNKCWGHEAKAFCEEIYTPHCCLSHESPEYRDDQGPKNPQVCEQDL